VTALALFVGTALVVTGAVAAAGTAVTRARSVAAVCSGAVLLVVADSGSLTASATTRSLAIAGRPVEVALLAVVVLGWRRATAAALAGAVLAGPVRQLLDDPFHDPSCELSCDPNPLVVVPLPNLADVVYVAGVVLMVGALLGVARTRDLRSVGVAVGVVLTAAALGSGHDAVTVVAACGAATVLVVDLSRSSTIRGRLAGAVEDLAVADDPDAVLGRALGGRAVTVGFPLGDGSTVDRGGATLREPPQSWTVVDVSGPDGPVAQLRADLRGVAPTTLAQVLRGPARLALENTRLAAEAAVRAREVRASAGRLVELAEEGRRRLERDLHDGAQRHVLTLGLAVQGDAGLAPEDRVRAASAVRLVLDQLREVAHGIRPAQLDTGGLARGLAALSDVSPVPLEVAEVAHVHGPAAEACYRLAEDAVRTATGPVRVAVSRGGDQGLTALVDVESGPGLPPRSSDRFLALGGAVRSERRGHGWRHHAELPEGPS
jgi:signal transduction histidine kinase